MTAPARRRSTPVRFSWWLGATCAVALVVSGTLTACSSREKTGGPGETLPAATSTVPPDRLVSGGPSATRGPLGVGESELPTITPDAATSADEVFTDKPQDRVRYQLSEESRANGDGVQGSGCTPPSRTVLTDGLWHGYVNSLLDGVIGFDLECSYYGEVQSVPGCENANDVCVINDSPLERTALVVAVSAA